jgi:drug/metabolite transporter (DMT)-like permease
MKYGIAGLDIFTFNGIRFVVAAAVLSGLVVGRRAWKQVERTDWLRLIRVGVVANVLYQVAFITGLSMTTAGNAAVLLSTAPLWTVFLSARLHRENIQPQVWVGMALSLCGVVMIIAGSGKKMEFGSSALFGDLVVVAAAMLWAFNTNMQKPLLSRYSALQLTFVMVTIGAIGLSVAAAPTALSMDWASVHWTFYLSAVTSGGLSIAAANLFWSVGVKQIGPGRTANFGNLVPVLALTISYITLNEQILLIQFIGAGVTVTGVWLAGR